MNWSVFKITSLEGSCKIYLIRGTLKMSVSMKKGRLIMVSVTVVLRKVPTYSYIKTYYWNQSN